MAPRGAARGVRSPADAPAVPWSCQPTIDAVRGRRASAGQEAARAVAPGVDRRPLEPTRQDARGILAVHALHVPVVELPHLTVRADELVLEELPAELPGRRAVGPGEPLPLAEEALAAQPEVVAQRRHVLPHLPRRGGGDRVVGDAGTDPSSHQATAQARVVVQAVARGTNRGTKTER